MGGYKRIPTQVVLAAFTKENGAKECLERCAKAMKEDDKFPICTNAAVAVKNENGKTKVKEYGKPNMLKGLVGGTALGAATGAAVGGAALSILGPIGVGAGALAGGAVGAPLGAVEGAMVGAVGKWTIEGMDKNKLEGLQDALEPGSSALVLVFAEVILNKKDYGTELAEYKKDSDEMAKILSENITKYLKDGKDSMQLLAATEDGVVAMKVVVDDKELDVAKVVLTEDATAVAEFKATADYVAGQRAVFTDNAIFAEGFVVGEDDAVAYEIEAVKE